MKYDVVGPHVVGDEVVEFSGAAGVNVRGSWVIVHTGENSADNYFGVRKSTGTQYTHSVQLHSTPQPLLVP